MVQWFVKEVEESVDETWMDFQSYSPNGLRQSLCQETWLSDNQDISYMVVMDKQRYVEVDFGWVMELTCRHVDVFMNGTMDQGPDNN